ncbi:unnamed protein product [Adineta ricciae]|uniref:Uncharacterized protein n=1 Tax=Adineta ricciae TaxID=249248 RepID=A0A813ZUJ4_ADIRI|nr:unnamed protein product [Adineta ricciae]CAF1198742.1 unnamed protein product [Adineta ricciae]
MSTVNDLCIVCKKKVGNFKCQGCEDLFCRHDLNVHRNELDSQLESVLNKMNTFQETSEEKIRAQKSTLLNEITDWEMKSIEKIRNAAKDARQQVEERITLDKGKYLTEFQEMKEEIRHRQSNDDFDERNLKKWRHTLDKLKTDISRIDIIVDAKHQNFPLVNSIFINLQDRFDQKCGDVHIEDDGHLACHNFNLFGSSGEIRGKNRYTSGTYRLYLHIQHLDMHPWWFFGIISESTPMQPNSHNSSSSYGWAGHNEVYMHGHCQKDVNGYVSDYAQGDTIELILKCDQRMIRMNNFRSKKSYTIEVDTKHCPFPWMIHLNLLHIQTRIRI